MTKEGVGEKTQRPIIENPQQTTAKLASLKPATNYRIYIKATTKAGSGEPYVFKYLYIFCFVQFFFLKKILNRFFIEQQTKPPLPEGTLLDMPVFTYEHLANNNVFDTVRISWKPKLDGNPGSHFFVKYR